MSRKAFSSPDLTKLKKTNLRRTKSVFHVVDPLIQIFEKFKTDIERISKNKTDGSIKINIPIINFTPNGMGYTIGNTSKIYNLLWRDLKINSASDVTHLYLLEKFGVLRKKLVDSIINSVIEELKCTQCTFESVGSTSLTSDYDVNLTSDLPYINNRIIEKFNERFYSIFNNTSDIVFDTNIYGIGFLSKSKKILPSENDYDQQMVFAFAKLVMLERRSGVRLFNRFPSLSDYNYYYDLAKTRIPLNGGYTLLLSDIQKFIGSGNTLSKFVDDSSVNKLYYLKDMISTANMYANETYFTQGAFLHVVGSLQGNLPFNKISKNDYILSCIENLFDIMKEYILYSDMESPSMFLLHSYKYIYRFYHAAYMAGLHNDKELLKIFKTLDNARKKKDNGEEIDSLQTKMDDLLGLRKDITSCKYKRPRGVTLQSNITPQLKKQASLPDNLCNNPHFYMTAFMQIFKRLDIPKAPVKPYTSKEKSNIVNNILIKINDLQ
mgnify:CR=1 FL=1